MSEAISTEERKATRSDRAEKRVLAGHYDKEIYRQFKIVAAEQTQSTEALLAQAIALLFNHYGKKQPASLKRTLKAKGLKTPSL